MDEIAGMGKSLYDSINDSALITTENNSCFEMANRQEDRPAIYENELDEHSSFEESVNLENISICLGNENESITTFNDSSNCSEIRCEDEHIEISQQRPKKRCRKTEEEDDDYEGEKPSSKKRITYRNRLIVCYKHLYYTHYIFIPAFHLLLE